jgi:hypothetical protein
MLPFTIFLFISVVVWGVFFYRAGQSEGRSGVMWAGLSVLVSVATWQGLGGGFFAILLGQVFLFAGITVYRTLRTP